jgi:FkbM family methyltransferase
VGSFRFERPSPYTLSYPKGYIGDRIEALRMPYEAFALRALAALTPKRGVILDVGANIGNHTAAWAAAGRRIHAFEPNPEALDWLRRNVTDNGFDDVVEIHPVALGQTKSPARLVDRGELSRTQVVIDDSGGVEMVPLDGITFDRIDALKIDVEGQEPGVLRGASQTLITHRPPIMTEAWNVDARQKLDDILKRVGYRRFPAPIGGGITYLYVHGTKGLARAFATPAVLYAAARYAISTTRLRPRRRHAP